MYRLFAIMFGDEVFIAQSRDIQELYLIATGQASRLKEEIGSTDIKYSITNGYNVIEQFTV